MIKTVHYTVSCFAISLLYFSNPAYAQTTDISETDIPSEIVNNPGPAEPVADSSKNLNIPDTVETTIDSGAFITSTANLDNETTVSESELVNAECRRIGGKLGSVNYTDCEELKLTYSGSRSVKNSPLLIKEYPPLTSRTPLGKVLLLGGGHGDEVKSAG